MYSLKIVLWCLVHLLVTSSMKSQGNYINDDERSDNLTVRYDSPVNSVKHQNVEMKTIQCNSCENSIKNDDEMQHESPVNCTENDRENNSSYKSCGHIKNREHSNQMSVKFNANSTKIHDLVLREINKNLTTNERESHSTSNEIYGNFNTDDSITSMCSNDSCVQLCCPLGENLTIEGNCNAGQGEYFFPSLYANVDKRLDEFPLIVRDPCLPYGFKRRLLDSSEYIYTHNGSVYNFPEKLLISPTNYCLAIVRRYFYDAIVCVEQYKLPIHVSSCLLVSLLFFLLTFVIYSIFPEFQIVYYSYMLRSHVASLFISYAMIYVTDKGTGLAEWMPEHCIPLAVMFIFSTLSSFFWLNVTFFDVWWTFRNFRLNKGSSKQDKIKFLIYSLYAWGIPLIYTVICIILDYDSGIPESWIRPEMCKTKIWTSKNNTLLMYTYIPVGVTIIGNFILLIVIMLTILHNAIFKDHQTRDSENKYNNDNRQRFQMYLLLLLLMASSWTIDLLVDLLDVSILPVVRYPSDIMNALQGVIIFIIFMCTKKNKQLFLKQFGGWNCGPFCKIPMSNDNAKNTTANAAVSRTLLAREVTN